MLINCSECDKQISDNAYACPNCGNPVLKRNSNVYGPGNRNRASRVKLSGFIVAAVGILIFLCAGLIGDGGIGSGRSYNYGGRYSRPYYTTYMTDSEEIASKGLRVLGLLVIGGGLFYALKGSVKK